VFLIVKVALEEAPMTPMPTGFKVTLEGAVILAPFGLAVAVGVAEGAGDAVEVADAVGLMVGVIVGVAVAILDNVAVGDGVGVIVGVGEAGTMLPDSNAPTSHAVWGGLSGSGRGAPR
jgi:hypothetical protein